MAELNEILRLAERLEDAWPEMMAGLRSSQVPLNADESGGGSGTSDGAGDSDDDSGSAGATGSGSADDDDDDDDTGSAGSGAEVDWKKMARKHERQAKKAQRERDAAEAKLKQREQADQSEQERAVAAAREEGESKARSESEKERRADRLENATLKLAGRGFKVKDEDGKEQTLRFADPDDAFTYVERMVRRGDVDEDELYDEKGKVQPDVLVSALSELLEEKPHLQANGDSGSDSGRKVKGSADGGRGTGGGKAPEELSTAEHLERMRKASAR